jgi:hypothetical protein
MKAHDYVNKEYENKLYLLEHIYGRISTEVAVCINLF